MSFASWTCIHQPQDDDMFGTIGQIVAFTLIVASGHGLAFGQDLWLMKGHDARRTGQSQSEGPPSIEPSQSWISEAPGAVVLNVGASVDEHGVYFGSWGLLRRDTLGRDTRFWDKSDGQLFGLDLDTGDPLWGEAGLDLDLVPRCYEYSDRGPNPLWCGLTPYEVSFYNGTVEGQAAIDTARGILYVGRGDGKLFAVDPAEGRLLWRFATFNPELPDDPDGGGEIISSPLLGPDGLVYFGTWGEGDYETDAFYAVNPDSTLAWRYPTASSLTHRIFASPALSPDGETIYVATFRDDSGNLPATLYAFHRKPLGPASDEDRLKWMIDLEADGVPFQSATLAVGTHGTIYVGGLLAQGFGVPAVTAIADVGDRAVYMWNPSFLELRDGAQYALGIALREVGGQTRRLYVTTANLGTALFNAKVEGALYALDPTDGAVLGSYDPSDDVETAVGSLNSPAIDASGAIYFGVRGRYGRNPINGYYFSVGFDEETHSFAKRWHHEVQGYVEWSHPAIGPDGTIYAGSSVNQSTDEIRTKTYDEGEIPEGSTPLFYALRGPTRPSSNEETTPLRTGFRLASVYPNPTPLESHLIVELSHPGQVKIEVADVLGRTVASLADGLMPAGRHTLPWDGRGVAAGVYLIHATWADAATGRTVRSARTIVRSSR